MTRSAQAMRTRSSAQRRGTRRSNHSSSSWDYPAGMLVLPFYLYTYIVHPLPFVIQPCKCAGLPLECMFSISFLPPFTRVCCSFSLVFVAHLLHWSIQLNYFLHCLYSSSSSVCLVPLLTSSIPKVLLFPPLSNFLSFPIQYLLFITFLFLYPS